MATSFSSSSFHAVSENLSRYDARGSGEILHLKAGWLYTLVEKIVVHQAQGAEKNKRQQLEIQYNFVSVLDTPEVAEVPSSVMIDTRQGVAVEYITRKAG